MIAVCYPEQLGKLGKEFSEVVSKYFEMVDVRLEIERDGGDGSMRIRE